MLACKSHYQVVVELDLLRENDADTQHVVQRGNDRMPCFTDDEDRRLYLTALREMSLRYACAAAETLSEPCVILRRVRLGEDA